MTAMREQVRDTIAVAEAIDGAEGVLFYEVDGNITHELGPEQRDLIVAALRSYSPDSDKAEIERLRGVLTAILNLQDRSFFSDAVLIGRALDIARYGLSSQSGGEREYDPGMDPCDDAEFGMKP